MKKSKWFLGGSNNSNKNQFTDRLEYLNHLLDRYSNEHANLSLVVDFNVRMIDSSMKEFFIFNGLKNVMKKPTCFKNSDKSTCIGFQYNTVLETGISDFHLLTATESKEYKLF